MPWQNPVFSTVTARAPEAARLDVRGVRSWIRSPWSWAALAALIAVAAVPRLRPEPAGVGLKEVVRFAVPVLPDDGRQVPTPFPWLWVTELAISPDGGRLVYTVLSSASSPDASFALYQRRMGQDQPEVLLAGSSTMRYERPFLLTGWGLGWFRCVGGGRSHASPAAAVRWVDGNHWHTHSILGWPYGYFQRHRFTGTVGAMTAPS
jgi:hypothetical protein